MAEYGQNNDVLDKYLDTLPNDMRVDAIEVFVTPGQANPIRVERNRFTEVDLLRLHLIQPPPTAQAIRILSVSRLSRNLAQLLGARYEMDEELWTCRFQSSDREWFAGPLMDRGARQFSHFNLSCVDFKRATAQTPAKFVENRKLGHTIRLVRLMYKDVTETKVNPRVFVIRKISGHIKLENSLWTFIYFNDPYINIDEAHYESDIPGRAQLPLEEWITDWVRQDSTQAFIDDISRDGFGFVVRVLREIKTGWKLLLNEMEAFLEDMVEGYDDDELIEAANWLHRKFLLNIDYFERQILYHRRYLSYLLNAPSQKGLCIFPSIFEKDLLQENDALRVADQRLGALRTRTSAILEAVVSLNVVKQARLAGTMAELQLKDAQLNFSQGQSIRRLTILNMVYLPATFIATVYGMNIMENSGERIWNLWSFSIVSLILTVFTLGFAIYKFERRSIVLDNMLVEEAEVPRTSHKKPLVHKWLDRLWKAATSIRLVRIRVEEKPLNSTVV